MVNLNDEYRFFEQNRSSLLKRYQGRFIVIKGSKIIGAYASEAEAYSETIKKHSLGTFLIQHCLPEKDLPPQVFHTRAVFG